MFDQLSRLLKSQRLPHGIIWADAATDELAAFVKLLLCHERTVNSNTACGHCKSCLLIESDGGHPDLQWLKPEGKLNLIKIDQVREVIELLSKSAQQGGYKVVVFEGAEGLNLAAQNALLKSLEEPSGNSFLVLQTAYSHLLLPTIKSRCQIISNKQELMVTTPQTVFDFIDAVSLDFNPISVAVKFKDASLEILFNGWYEFLFEALKQKQGLTIDSAWHSWRVNIEGAAAKSSERLYEFINELIQLKAMLNKKIAINQQALLERALIHWQSI